MFSKNHPTEKVDNYMVNVNKMSTIHVGLTSNFFC